MSRRLKLCSGTVLALLFIWLVLPFSGCGGCGQSAADKKQAEADAEKKRYDEEKEKKDKRKPDFEISQSLHIEPADPEQPIVAAKPGHWLTVNLKATANNFDFTGSLQAGIFVQKNSQALPLALERQPFVLLTTRDVVLPKGQQRNLDQTLFIPRGEHAPWVDEQIDTRGGTPVLEPPKQPLDRMPAYQYFFVILAREPSRYKRFSHNDALLGPLTDGNLRYYLVSAPRIDKYVPLPANPLAWTSTAYVLWDNVDPSLLSVDQKQAMIDWLHWGGQLIVSGPDTLTLLHSSFLDPYLPATAGKSRTLTADSLAALATMVHPTGTGKAVSPLEPARPWSAVTLELRPSGHWLLDTHSHLIAECAVGRGRIVVTAFELSQRELMNWAGFDPLLNACLLRHPPRKYVGVNHSLDRSSAPEWADKNSNRFDPRLTCGLRYLSRDLADDGDFAAGGDAEETTAQPDAAAVNPDGPPVSAVAMPAPLGDEDAVGSGVGGWNDFSGVSSAARESLRSAAGITIPGSAFIAWMLIAYLTVLGPLNWGFFRLLGRVEWAWIAAPLIAILGAVVVTKAAHLNIGFARSQTEVELVELQPDYPRAHLTRYTALYTSLSTSYDIWFDDPNALVQPFAIGGESRLQQVERTVTLRRNADVRLTGFEVSSNSTAMLHSEQMIDFGGGIGCSSETGRLRAYNHSKYTLQQSGVVWRAPSGQFETAWIGELPAGRERPLVFHSVHRGLPALPEFCDPLAAKPGNAASERPSNLVDAADVKLAPGKSNADPSDVARLSDGDISQVLPEGGTILDIVTSPAGFAPGEMRLVGLLAEPLPGMVVTPESSQSVRACVFVVANLRYASPPPPQADVNLRPSQNATVEPREESP